MHSREWELQKPEAICVIVFFNIVMPSHTLCQLSPAMREYKPSLESEFVESVS